MEARLLMGVVLLVVVSTPVVISYGCMCSIAHPQQKFCNAEFVLQITWSKTLNRLDIGKGNSIFETVVITGRMENMEWILIPQLVPTEGPLEETSTEGQQYIGTQASSHGHQNQPSLGNITSGNHGNTYENMMENSQLQLDNGPTEVNDSFQINPLQNLLQDDPVAQSGANRGFNPSDREAIMMEPRNYNVLYVIEVEHIYKDSERIQLTKGKTVRLLAPPPQRYFPMCSYSAVKRRRLYLFAVQNSDMMTECDWVEEYRSLSKNQKQGIKSAYQRSCEACQINLSPSGMGKASPLLQSNGTCMAEMKQMMVTFPDYMRSDCYAMYSHCALRKGICKWYSSKDFKVCKKSSQPQGNENT